ncbi:MAG: extracellular solute-binding protein, partial [Treponema sp.]|nr:extracellular solute-binding protein [Treponema sp.]
MDIFAWVSGKGLAEMSGFEAEPRALRMEEDGFAEYRLMVETAGFYRLYIEYFPVESRGIPIERGVLINGETPFLGAERIAFPRVWGDAGPVRKDNQGNEIRPSQTEKPRWEGAYFRDALGYVSEPYLFYFEAGENSIVLEGINEPLVIRRFELKAPVPAKPYREYIAGIDRAGYQNQDNAFAVKLQGETAARRSDPSLYPVYDRSSGETEPASADFITLNMIGGQSWRVAGQWIEWDFEVPGDGLYRISIKGRQNYNRGFVSNRSVEIDREIPCAELGAAPFRYSGGWELLTLQDGAGEDLVFPLKKGGHTIRLTAALGELGNLLNTMEESVYRLNGMYRKILVLTGSSPDPFRDYQVDVVYPSVIEAMAAESRMLYKLADDFNAYTEERSPQTAAILTLARQLELFIDRPDKIPALLENFKGNISALGDSISKLAESQLDIDYLIVSAPGAELPRVSNGFITQALHELKSFFASFFIDYNNLGNVYEGSGAVQVWLMTGRDQSAILKAMVDDTFTPQTGIPVNVKLVGADALMPSVVAGTGPDLALSLGTADPVNYALRHAAVDLSQFPDFDEVIRQFHPSALEPYRYAGGVYGLPETQVFQLMFYRKDIFAELGLEPPSTWKDVITMLPVIQKNNMNVGIPSLAGAVTDMSGFFAQLYQRGGALYNADSSRALLDGELAVEAFDYYIRFFTHYKTPQTFDFVNRFRTGEIPLAFADFTAFNTLEVFAPEIRGLWGFGLMPGTPQADGIINRSVSTASATSVLFSIAKNREGAWEFLKWWASAETQLRFGREMESVMGAAARYATAN